MGARHWEHLAPWNPNPVVALHHLQESFLAENYDVRQVILDRLQSMREAVKGLEEEGDEYGILDIYKDDLKRLEEYASKPIPQALELQIEMLRKIEESGGEGIGNILDVTDVADTKGVCIACQITDDEIERLLGTTKPTLENVKKMLDLISNDLDRGESVCCPVYADGKPSGWLFVGYTID